MSMNGIVYALDKRQAEQLQEMEDEDEFFQELEAARSMELGSTWHGLHYLLTGTAGRFAGSQGFLVEGGAVGGNLRAANGRRGHPRRRNNARPPIVGIRLFPRAGQGSYFYNLTLSLWYLASALRGTH